MEDNDPYTEFFDDYITKNEKALLSKTEVIEAIEMWKKFKNVPEWGEIKKEFKRRGYAYDSQKQKNKKKGFFIGQSSGAYLAATSKLLEKIKSGNVVTIINDLGERYFSTGLWD